MSSQEQNNVPDLYQNINQVDEQDKELSQITECEYDFEATFIIDGESWEETINQKSTKASLSYECSKDYMDGATFEDDITKTLLVPDDSVLHLEEDFNWQ